MELPGGLLVRAARPDDLDQIGALLADRGDPADAEDHRLVVEDPGGGYDACGVVVDGDRVVSTATLLDETVVLAGLPIPAGQVELVATDHAYEGRGLVRALMGWAHDRSARRGHLVQVMIGIPYFYRQFGYQYTTPIPQGRVVHTVPSMPDGCSVRVAGPDDIGSMAALQDEAQRAFDLIMPHSPMCWRALVSRAGSAQLVVERDGRMIGTGRVTPPEEGVMLGEVAGPEAVPALLAHAARLAGGEPVEAKDRGGLLSDFLVAPEPEARDYYVRVPDVVALLEHLRPVLSARLASTSGSGQDDVIVSFFRRHVRLRRAGGVITGIVEGGPMQGPASHGGAGVAPDLIAPLLFGPHGIAGLTAAHADVYPGPHGELMRALFPPVTSDLLTFYLP